MSSPVSVIVPARNEAATIGKVVETLQAMPGISEVVVVDNGSHDDTAKLAAAAGARTVFEARTGMGHALKAGIWAASHDWVMKVDADLGRFDTSLFSRLPKARAPGVGLIKGAWQDPNDDMPMTRLLVMPALSQMFPGLVHLQAPNSGIYLFNRALISHAELVGDYAADLDVMLRVHAAGAEVVEVDIGRIVHDQRSPTHYKAMAETILAFFLQSNKVQLTRETIVLAQNSGQIIGNCLGILAARSINGAAVSVYLAEAETEAAWVLRDTLSAFPTARVEPLENAAEFRARPHTAKFSIIAPYPVQDQDRALSMAIQLLKGHDAAELMLMQPGTDAAGFVTDIALEIGNGAGLKQAALARIGAGQGRVLPREIFQSIQSLSEAGIPALRA